jgi:hypothetical protein
MIEAAALGIGLLAGGFWVLAALSVILALAALLNIVRDTELTGGSKAMWVVLILIFPLFGSLIYLGVRSDW